METVPLCISNILEYSGERPEYSSFIHGKAEVGKPRTWGFDLHTPPPPERKDDETAIRALRGWSDAVSI